MGVQLIPGQEPASAADRLLSAAERIVLDEGTQGVTIRAIARESGLNSALVSYHFSGIEPLLARLLDLNVDRICDSRAAQVQEALRLPDGSRRLEALLCAYLDPLWRTMAVWHLGPARTVVRALVPRLPAAQRLGTVSRINQSIEDTLDAFLPVLPHLDRDTLLLRLQLLAGAADELRLRAHEMGMFTLRGDRAARQNEALRAELMTMGLASLRAAG